MRRKKIRNRLLDLATEKAKKEGKLVRESQLARDLDVTRATVHAWLFNEVSKFEEGVILAICEHFGCDLNDLLYIETVEDEAVESAQE